MAFLGIPLDVIFCLILCGSHMHPNLTITYIKSIFCHSHKKLTISLHLIPYPLCYYCQTFGNQLSFKEINRQSKHSASICSHVYYFWCSSFHPSSIIFFISFSSNLKRSHDLSCSVDLWSCNSLHFHLSDSVSVLPSV